MSIDCAAHLIVGLHGTAWDDTPLKTEGFNDVYDLLVESLGLECFDPYFDCGYSESYYGFSIASGVIADPALLKDQILEASQKFIEITGKVPTARIVLDAY